MIGSWWHNIPWWHRTNGPLQNYTVRGVFLKLSNNFPLSMGQDDMEMCCDQLRHSLCQREGGAEHALEPGNRYESNIQAVALGCF